MKLRRFILSALVVACACLGTAWGEDKDWLLDPAPYVSEISYDETNSVLKLSNGLISRRVLLAPNAATISLRNDYTGEELVRAIAPEARVTIDGESYCVGGLTGFPVANYWKETWAKDARVLPNSYRFTRYEVGEIEPRFEYKPRPEWLSKEYPWPPKGKRVVMFYDPPEKIAPPTSGALLLEEPFTSALDDSWRAVVSGIGERTSVANEGKPGEIYAIPDTCAYLEREWVENAVAVSVTLDVGDDELANSWGPGVAVFFTADSDSDDAAKVVSVVARPHSAQYELCVDGREVALVGSFDRDKDVTFTLALADDGVLKLDAFDGAGVRTTVGEVKVSGTPKYLRVGKVGKGGSGKDYPTDSREYRRSHLKRVAFYAPLTQSQREAPQALPKVEVRYEIYDGSPLISKRLYVRYPQDCKVKEFVVDTFTNEELRLVETDSIVDEYAHETPFNLGLLTDYVCGGMATSSIVDNRAYRVKSDPDYPTQVNYLRKTLCLLECSPEFGPAQVVDAEHDFASNTIYELLYDNTERERRGLAMRRAMRTLAPWTNENPLMFHMVRSAPDDVRDGVEQCRETGYEVLIMSFGSGFDLESDDKTYRQTYRELSDEAKRASVALGGYSLTSSRGAANKEDNVLNEKPQFGVGPCLGSAWGRQYLQSLKDFMEEADFGVFENDGPYPGDYCESREHPGHRGKEDSVWTQREAQAELYRWCRARGIYVNQPDAYFLDGGNKTGMGYRETNWSLPHAEQVIIERQNVYDGTWTKTQSMGWMFVPLSQYHGGGAAATIEPLKDHLEHYDARFADLIGAGVQACWRGPRLYDSEETKAVVRKWTSFYHENRRILDSDIVHLRRASGRDWDGILHVDPDTNAKTRALAFLYNPTLEPITRKIVIPLYYAGLKDKAQVRIGDSDLELGEPTIVELNDKREAVVEITIPAEKYAFATFETAL